MRGAAAQGARTRIEDSLARQVVGFIFLLLFGIAIVVDVEFPRELVVFRAARMPCRDLVVVGLFLVAAGFENENAVAGLGKPHRHRPAAGTGSYDNEIVFIVQFVCGHGGASPAGTIDDRELLRKRAGPTPLISDE